MEKTHFRQRVRKCRFTRQEFGNFSPSQLSHQLIGGSGDNTQPGGWKRKVEVSGMKNWPVLEKRGKAVRKQRRRLMAGRHLQAA